MSSCCPPSCTVPTCVSRSCCSPCSYPTGGLGTLSSCCNTSCCGGPAASSLGISPCVNNIGCVNQIPPSEVTIQPAPCHVILPGPILSASCEPVRVGGYTACGGSCCPPCGSICSKPC